MTSKHPIMGQEYDVQSDALPTGIPDGVESIVPVGTDEYGNIRVDHYGDVLPDEPSRRLWSEDTFTESVANGRLVER